MNNDIIKTLFLVLIICSFISCKDTLNLRPPDSVTNDSFWNTSKDFKLATNYYYEGLPGYDSFNATVMDNDSDIQYGQGQNTISSGNLVPSANDDFWDNRYSMLRQINSLLIEASRYANPEEIRTSVAEAKFFRAFEYFRLVRRYGDVPYYEKPLTPSDEELFKSRTPRTTVINNVLADLDDAIPDLPLESETSGSGQGRVTSGAALALKAQVALFEGTWAKYHDTEGKINELLDIAINAANKVVNSKEYSLFVYEPDPTKSYKFSYSVYANDSKEQVLAKRYDREIQPNSFTANVCCSAGISYGTKKLADMYVSTDGLPIDQSPLFQGYGTMVSEYQNRDLRMTNTLNVPGTPNPDAQNPDPDEPNYPSLDETGYGMTKFIYTYEGLDFGRGYDFKFIIKYPLVLLNLAEALYERNGTISDQDLDRTINVLRDRANVEDLSNAFVGAHGLNMLEEIRRERTVELAWDGFRLHDLRRWNMAVNELGQAIKGVNLASGAWDSQYDADVIDEYPVDENGFKIVQPASDRNFSERHYLFPIPTQQIQLNPKLTQNPGY